MPPLVSLSSSDDPPCRKPPAAETCHHRHLHSVPRQGGAGDLRRRSGIHHPLTRFGNPTPLHPSAEERKLHRQLWGSNSGVISRFVSKSMEMTEEAEDEEAIAGEGEVDCGSCYQLEEEDE
jgi:hypothetical protein